MRLVSFVSDTPGFNVVLPTYNATTQPLASSIRISISQTSNGFVVNRNVPFARQPQRLVHSGSYLSSSPTVLSFNDTGAYQRVNEIESLIGHEGTLRRSASEYGEEISLAGNTGYTDEIRAILESVTVPVSTENLFTESKHELRVSFTFFLLEDEWSVKS